MRHEVFERRKRRGGAPLFLFKKCQARRPRLPSDRHIWIPVPITEGILSQLRAAIRAKEEGGGGGIHPRSGNRHAGLRESPWRHNCQDFPCLSSSRPIPYRLLPRTVSSLHRLLTLHFASSSVQNPDLLSRCPPLFYLSGSTATAYSSGDPFFPCVG